MIREEVVDEEYAGRAGGFRLRDDTAEDMEVGNSRQGTEHLWVAEITEARELELKCDPMPLWFQETVWDKINTHA